MVGKYARATARSCVLLAATPSNIGTSTFEVWKGVEEYDYKWGGYSCKPLIKSAFRPSLFTHCSLTFPFIIFTGYFFCFPFYFICSIQDPSRAVVQKPPLFALRIAVLLALSWLHVFILFSSALVIPVVIGRFLLGMVTSYKVSGSR